MAGPYARSPEKASPSTGSPLMRDIPGSPSRGGSKRAPRSAPPRPGSDVRQLRSPVKSVYQDALLEGFMGKYGPVDDASIAAADKHAIELKKRYARARTEEERERWINLASEATLKANMMRAERDFLQRQGREVRGAARVDARGAPAHRTFAGTDEEHAAAVRMQRIQRGRAARDRVKAMRRERASNRARDDARVRHDAAARIQAAVRAKTARERVGKMRAEERVAAARARVARNAAAERAVRWREPEQTFESPYLHSAPSSREATPVKSRPASASSRDEATTATTTATTTTTAASPSGRRPASGITFPGEDDHVRRMRAFRERVEAKANAIGALPVRRTRAAPPPKPSPAKSILKSPADRPRSSPGAIESASPRRGFLDDDDTLVQSAGAPSPGDAHRATAARPREARRSLRVSFELAEDRPREDSPATMAREAELAMDERFRPRGVQRNSKTAVAAARDAERALAAAEAAVVTATRNKAARDRVKARAGGRPRATPGRKIVVVDEDSDSLPGAARSQDRIPSSPSPSPRRAQSSARRTPPTAGRSPSLELSPSPVPAGRAPVRATARAFRPSKNERAREYNDRLREREHRERLRRRERAVQAERAAAVQAGVSMADHLDSKLTARQRAAAIMRQVDAAQRNSETVAGIFVSYVAARKSGEEIDRRHAKDVVSMARSMPAFRALPPGHVADALAAAEVTRHAAGSVIFHEGDRGDALCAVVGGEVALFQKGTNLKGPKELAPDYELLWATESVRRGREGADATFRLAKPGDKRPGSAVTPTKERGTRGGGRGGGRGEHRGGGGAYDGDDGIVTDAAHDVQAAALGAPKHCGRLARRVRLGHAFGDKAATRRGGEARAATAVALSPVTVLAISRFKYATIMKAVEATEAADVADFLRDTELFPETRVSDADLRELASKLVVVRAGPGDTVVAAGDHAKGAFFVRSGRAKVSATARVMVEPPDEVVRTNVDDEVGWDGVRGSSVRSSVRSSRDSLYDAGEARSSSAVSPLRPRTGSGGGAWRRAPTYETRDVPLGELVPPAIFGEECLVPFEYSDDAGGGVGPGRHAFTVRVDPDGDPDGATFLRLPPPSLVSLPAVVAKRLTQLAKSTSAASKEATKALDDVEGGPSTRISVDSARRSTEGGGWARRSPSVSGGIPPAPSVASPSVRAGFGTSAPPRNEPTKFDRRFDSRVDEGRAPVGVGLGGGGGRTREVGTPSALARRARRDSRVRPATALAAMTRTEMRAGGFVPSSPSGGGREYARRPRSAVVAGASPVRPSAPSSSLDPDSTFEDYLDHDDDADADASFGSPWGTPAKGEASSYSRARELRSSILGPPVGSSATPGRAGGSRGGSTKAWRKAPDVQVRLTKKAAALAEKNRPIREWRERGRAMGGGGADGDGDGYSSARPATATGAAAGRSTAGVVGDRDRVRPATAAAAMDYGGLWGDNAYDMGGWTRGSKL